MVSQVCGQPRRSIRAVKAPAVSLLAMIPWVNDTDPSLAAAAMKRIDERFDAAPFVELQALPSSRSSSPICRRGRNRRIPEGTGDGAVAAAAHV